MQSNNPLLREAYVHDMYYPWSGAQSENPELYDKAAAEGWAEWIQTPLDMRAVQNGFQYDLSRDVDGRPCFWHDGAWHMHDGVVVSAEDEEDAVGYVGRGDHMMRFCECFLVHTKAPLAGDPYRFLPWMRIISAQMFGWVKNTSKLRRFQNLYIAVAKKNGKSALMSAYSIYMMLADGTPKAYVFGCACDRNQARIVYDEAAHMVRSSPTLANLITVVDSRARLAHPDSGSYYQVLSADAHRNDGYDSSCTLIDEIHRHPTRRLYTVMKRAGQARPNPLLAVITTYGPSLSDGSIWAEIHNEAKQQLEGNRPNSWRRLSFIASAEPITVVNLDPVPEGTTRIPVRRLEQPINTSEITFDLSHHSDVSEEDQKLKVVITEPAKRYQDFIEVEPLERELPAFSEAKANTQWRDEHGVHRANPSAGVVFPVDRLLKEIDEARSPEAEAETMQLNFNIVAGSGRKWISSAAWTACAKWQVQPNKYLVNRQCYGGLDISFGNDLTAFGLAFPNWEITAGMDSVEKPRIDLMTWAWLPTDSIEEREEREQFPYRHYAKQDYFLGKGCVRMCQGAVIDFGQVTKEIAEICAKFEVVGIAYDPNYASFCVPHLETEGLVCVSHRQGAVSMSPPCKRFSEIVYKGWMAHGSNPVLDRAIEGAQLHPPDKAGNTYLAKSKSVVRIDPLVAQVMAVGFCCDPPQGIDGAYSSSSSGMWG